MHRPFFLAVSLLAAMRGLGQAPFHVKDPNASFLEVSARRVALGSAVTPRVRDALGSVKSCTVAPAPAPPPASQDIPSRYKSGSHGELNPEEHTLSEPYYRVQETAARGANRYLVTGDPAEASCVVKILLPWARAQALLHYTAKDDMVVWFQSSWTVASLSLAMSVVRGEPTLNPAERDEVIAWLNKAAHKAVGESRGPNSGTSNNNHFFWRGLAATAAGVISGDDALFEDGIATYAMAIGEMNADGSFPAEMARHELALHYQAFAIEPLVMIAELALRQGYNLYPLTENKHHLREAIEFLHRAIADPSLVKQYAPEPQKMEFEPGSTLLSWVEFWSRRDASGAWKAELTQPFFDMRLAGSTTLYAAPASEAAAVTAPPASAPAKP